MLNYDWNNCYYYCRSSGKYHKPTYVTDTTTTIDSVPALYYTGDYYCTYIYTVLQPGLVSVHVTVQNLLFHPFLNVIHAVKTMDIILLCGINMIQSLNNSKLKRKSQIGRFCWIWLNGPMVIITYYKYLCSLKHCINLDIYDIRI